MGAKICCTVQEVKSRQRPSAQVGGYGNENGQGVGTPKGNKRDFVQVNIVYPRIRCGTCWWQEWLLGQEEVWVEKELEEPIVILYTPISGSSMSAASPLLLRMARALSL